MKNTIKDTYVQQSFRNLERAESLLLVIDELNDTYLSHTKAKLRLSSNFVGGADAAYSVDITTGSVSFDLIGLMSKLKVRSELEYVRELLDEGKLGRKLVDDITADVTAGRRPVAALHNLKRLFKGE